MLFVSLQGMAQHRPPLWLKVCSDVNNYYHSATYDKKRAVDFLLENAPYHLTKVNDTLSSYYEQLAQINKDNRYPQCKPKMIDLYQQFNMQQQFDWVSDTLLLTPQYIIDNVDSAYASWKEGRYANHLTFDDFCEYLLPYRVGTENISRWRKELSDRFSHRIDWMQVEDDKKSSAYWAALYLNDQIKNLGFHIDAVQHYGGIDLPYQALKNIKMGECEDYAEFTAYVMRSCGIPVAIDFTPQWPFRSSGHYWNTVLDNSGRNIPFMGGESNPGYPCKAGYVMGKVYRKTYAYQKESLFALNSKYSEIVPSLLNSPFIKDVSKEYVRGVEVMATQNEAVKQKGKYRYWRYVSPKNGHCNVAEIIFKKAKHTVPFDSIMNDYTTENGYDVRYAFDNNELTFYESKKADNGWIGVDFGKAVSIDNIVYLPRNDDNNVVPGHLYELDYYDGTQKVSLGVKKSVGYEITFEGVPTNALYILHDLSKGSEERVFTYENGEVKWY